MFGVEVDRFDHKVEFVGAVDFARYAVSHFGLDEQGFREVLEPVNPLGVVVLEQEYRESKIPRYWRSPAAFSQGVRRGENCFCLLLCKPLSLFKPFLQKCPNRHLVFAIIAALDVRQVFAPHSQSFYYWHTDVRPFSLPVANDRTAIITPTGR